MTFAAARAELAALAVLDRLEAALAGQHRHANCPDCGTPITCCEMEKSDE